MPVDRNAAAEVSAYRWVPPFAQGLVRDLRVRWALEEAGLDYSVRLLDPREARPADYLEQQPFGQVPAYRDGGVSLFESGAIVLQIGERCEALLPKDPEARAKAVQWVLAALNTIEPQLQLYAGIELFFPGQDWTAQAREAFGGNVRKRLAQLAGRLGDHEWLEDRFTAGDLVMVSVLRILRDDPLIREQPSLVAYVARGEARPAFQRALDAQLADFEKHEPAPA